MNVPNGTIPACLALACLFPGCSATSTESPSATGTQEGASTPASVSQPVSGAEPDATPDDARLRELVRTHLTVLLSRPSFRVLNWSDETVRPFGPANYQIVTGRLAFVNVFQEETSHEFAVLLLSPDELLRFSIDGECIWGKSFENVKPEVQAHTSPEEFDEAYGQFAAQYEAAAGRTATTAAADSSDRTWTDRTGRYVVPARLLGKTPSGLIRLEKENGTVINLAESELSGGDREWIREHASSPPEASESFGGRG